MIDVAFLPNKVMAPHHRSRLGQVMNACKKRKLSIWSCKKTTSPGDLYLFYFGEPAHQIVAVGIAFGEVWEEENDGWDWTDNFKGWFCDFAPIYRLSTPILMSDIKAHRVLGRWWSGFPYRGSAKTIKEPYRGAILSLITSQNPRLKGLLSRFGNVVKVNSSPVSRPPKKGSGQGFSLSAEDRKLIDRRAVDVAISHYRSKGLRVLDCSEAHPYDLCCTQGKKTLYVEVKGSTGTGDQIELTPNEVKFAHRNGNSMECFLVHSVTLEGEGSQRKAKGGKKKIIRPWIIQAGYLTPTGYTYRLTRP